MIPKIIHYCWLSGDSYPKNIKKCMKSWKKILPDYEFVLWDLKRFPLEKSLWVKQAFEKKKYAFAADYIRFYALYHYGGIYLDSDVQVLKSYNDLLDLPYFMGQENSEGPIEAATMGFEPNHPLLKSLLDYYEDRPFIKAEGSFDMWPVPNIIKKNIEASFTYNLISDKKDFDTSANVINVFPSDFFSPKDFHTKIICVTDNTYSIHQFDGSWLRPIVEDPGIIDALRIKIAFRSRLRRLKQLLRWNH